MSSNKPITVKRLTGKILFVFLFLIIASISYGQTYLGLTTGYVITTPHASFSSSLHISGNLTYQNSFFISFDYREQHRERSSLGASVLYTFQNTDYYVRSGGHMGGSTTDGSFSYGYLDFHFYPEFSYGEKVKFYFNFGPYFGFLLHSNSSGTQSWIQYSLDTIPPKEGTKELDGRANEYVNFLTLGLEIGIGVRYALNDKINLHADFSNRIGSMDLSTDGYAKFLTNIFFAIGVEMKIIHKERPAKE
jgi:hypothetical protein